jgi:hypothetical protein
MEPLPQMGGLRIAFKKHVVFSYLSCPKFLKILSRYNFCVKSPCPVPLSPPGTPSMFKPCLGGCPAAA